MGVCVPVFSEQIVYVCVRVCVCLCKRERPKNYECVRYRMNFWYQTGLLVAVTGDVGS